MENQTRKIFVIKAWWLSGRIGAFCPEGRRFESHSDCHVGTLSKFLAQNALQYHCICAARRESALLSLACIRKKEGRYQRLVVLYCD